MTNATKEDTALLFGVDVLLVEQVGDLFVVDLELCKSLVIGNKLVGFTHYGWKLTKKEQSAEDNDAIMVFLSNNDCEKIDERDFYSLAKQFGVTGFV